MNDLFMTFTSRLKVDAKYELISSEIDQSGKLYLDTPQLIEYVGICVMSWVLDSELGDSYVYLPIAKKLCGNFSLNSPRACALGLPWEFF